MASRFDKRTNVFNPSGRINQIEFAIQAIKNSAPALAIKYANGVVFLTQKRSDSRLSINPSNGEKIFKIDDHIYTIVSGMSADGDRLIDKMRSYGQDHLYQYDSPIPLEQLVERISSLKQAYT